MAGCSSSVGMAHFKSLKDGVVLLECFSSKSLLATKFQCFSINGTRTNTRLISKSKRQRLVVVNVSNPETESKSSPELTTTTPEMGDMDYFEKDATKVVEKNYLSTTDSKNGDGGSSIDRGGGNGKFLGGGGGDGGGGGGDDGADEYEEKECGPLLKFEEVMRETEARGASLPADMLEAAKTVGLRKLLLLRYLDLQIVIDSCCATFAEVKQRGKDFWAEFELYTADLLVGVVVNVALVGMLAPYARIGQLSASQSFLGRMQRGYAALPSSVFEAERPGSRFSVNQRIATYFYKGILYGLVGFGCGIVGQGIANLIMTAKRYVSLKEYF